MTGARYAAAMQAATRRMPFGLADVVPPTLLGFGLINLTTFGLDLVLLDVLHGRAGWPLPVAVSVAYGVALTVSYLLNRVLNFRSRAPRSALSSRSMWSLSLSTTASACWASAPG